MRKKITQLPTLQPRWLAKIRSASKKNGTNKLSMDAINRIVALIRRKESVPSRIDSRETLATVRNFRKTPAINERKLFFFPSQ